MATPALKDLPKVDVDLKSQLESFSPTALKSASTEEKCLLPTAEGKNMEINANLLYIYCDADRHIYLLKAFKTDKILIIEFKFPQHLMIA